MKPQRTAIHRDFLKSLVADYEKKMIFAALARTRGNQSQAAKLLGTTKRILTYKVHKYAIDTEQFRP
jgi:Nif-specific regulatory protein